MTIGGIFRAFATLSRHKGWLVFLGTLVAQMTFFCTAVNAKEQLSPHANVPLAEKGGPSYAIAEFLTNRPLDIHLLLGRHISEILPREAWKNLPVPEEYKNKHVRYSVAGNLKDYTSAWNFMQDNLCVSEFSNLLLFFNRGFLFRIELRYISGNFVGSRRAEKNPPCGDEALIFNLFAKHIGGYIEARGDSRQIIKYDNRVIMTLYTDDLSTSLTWLLRGGPSLGGI